jgi:spermidine dehydrogenase
MSRDPLGLDARMTRRDFVNGTLAAATFCAAGASARAAAAGASDPWTGPGGIGDYARSNGNTREVVEAAHGLRDGRYDGARMPDPDEPEVDLVIVGAGITGLMAAWDFRKLRGDGGRCLLLDNHPMFGGEAKGNVVEVDGVRLEGPQGSNAFAVPHGGPLRRYWTEIGMPESFAFHAAEGATPGLRVARDHFGPMQHVAHRTSIGYWFRDANGRGAWHRDVWQTGFAGVPLPENVRRDLLRWVATDELPVPADAGTLPDTADLVEFRRATEQSAIGRWLDSMSYATFLETVLKLSPAVSRWIDPLVATGLSGTASDAVSAYAAQRILLPGVTPARYVRIYETTDIVTSPIGNGMLARQFVKALVPGSFPRAATAEDLLRSPVDLAALDVPGTPTRLRLGATVVRVEHEGDPRVAERVRVSYVRDGRLASVRAKALIMAGGGWINRRVARDMPDDVREAYAGFEHGPVLVMNVALRHWRFLERQGFSGAHWFDGFGWFANVIPPMKVGRADPPFHPDKPIMLTSYVPFLSPGLPARDQCSTGRARLLGASYRDLERAMRRQLQEMFGRHGFDARRDVRGLVTNRWGHAYVCAQPGFFFGRDSRPPARDVVRAGYGRVRFAHAELQGNQSILSSAIEAERAVGQIGALV